MITREVFRLLVDTFIPRCVMCGRRGAPDAVCRRCSKLI